MALARYFGIGALFVGSALFTAAGCSSSSSTTGTGGAGGTSSTGGTSGTGGTGGSGGSAGTGGTGGSGGGVTPAFKAMSPCGTEDAYMKGVTTITTSGLSFSPKCLQVKKGTKVTFSSSLMFGMNGGHQLAPSMTRTDPGNPIPDNPNGASVDVTFSQSGFFGYYCPLHDNGDPDQSGVMNGVVWVTD